MPVHGKNTSFDFFKVKGKTVTHLYLFWDYVRQKLLDRGVKKTRDLPMLNNHSETSSVWKVAVDLKKINKNKNPTKNLTLLGQIWDRGATGISFNKLEFMCKNYPCGAKGPKRAQHLFWKESRTCHTLTCFINEIANTSIKLNFEKLSLCNFLISLFLLS